MDWQSLPSLNALKAFTAVAQTKSLSQAGAALNVSHAAISQHIKSLEGQLDATLVTREGRGVALTAEGETLAKDLLTGFQTIQRAVSSIGALEATRALQLTMTPSFAMNWLMPRLSAFRQSHPDIEFMLNPTAEVVALSPGGVDLAFRFGEGNWPGLTAELLLPTDFVIVASPDLLAREDYKEPKDLARLPWLQELGTDEVSRWLTAQNIWGASGLRLNQMPGYMVLESLRSGDGVAATARSFVEKDIAAGTLEVLHEDPRETAGYYVVTRQGVLRPPLKKFVTWLKRQQSEL